MKNQITKMEEMNRYILSSWQLNAHAQDMELHIYEMPLTNVDEYHSENGKNVYQLYIQNNKMPIVFAGKLIASLSPIEKWEGVTPYHHYEKRVISLESPLERQLLERLVLKKMELSSPLVYKGFYTDPSFYEKIGDLGVKRGLKLSVNVTDEGFIVLNGDVRHKFFKNISIEEKVNKGLLQEDTEVADAKGVIYRFIKKESYTVHDIIPEWSNSIYNYYEKNGYTKELKQLKEGEAVVSVRNMKFNKPIYYAASMLSEVVQLSGLRDAERNRVNKMIKLSPNQKIDKTITYLQAVLRTSGFAYSKHGLLAHSQGYALLQLPKPMFLFGENRTSQYIASGLGGKIYEHGRSLSIHLFLEKQLVDAFRQNSKEGISVKQFIKELREASQKMGVDLQIVKKTAQIEDYTDVTFKNELELKLKMKKIAPQLEAMTIVLARDKNLGSCYEVLKKEFAKSNVPSQVITQSTMDINERGKKYALYNILLGIYAKAGIQPWILKETLQSDCFIGLDVSHEEGRHATGIVQIIGKDGQVLDTSTLSSQESGEIIHRRTFEEIITNAIYHYENEFGKRPKHLTFHRDGNGHEAEITAIKEIMDSLSIAFDYVSVIKDTGKRLAYREQNNQWVTIEGSTYVKNKVAYMVTTSPHVSMGMAKPIKINHRYGDTPIEDIVRDAYHLSFMHIAAVNKARLPVTTHYADKSSTLYNRGIMPTESMGKKLYMV